MTGLVPHKAGHDEWAAVPRSRSFGGVRLPALLDDFARLLHCLDASRGDHDGERPCRSDSLEVNTRLAGDR